MSSPFRFGLVAALATACHLASAQTVVPPAVSVQRFAPQLVAFAGSQSNFDNLVNGLTGGTQVQLVTLLPDGFTQVVTFAPGTQLSPQQAAQVLETARQRLISLGIANPTAEQIATALVGGRVPTALGGAQVPSLLTPTSTPGQTATPGTPSPAVQAQANAAVGNTLGTGALGAGAGATTPTTPSTVAPGVNVQLIPTTTASTPSTPPVNTSDSPTAPGSVSRSPVPAAPSLPGPSLVPNPPAPGERASAIAPAPAAPTVTPPIATPPVPTPPAQSGNTNSGISAVRR